MATYIDNVNKARSFCANTPVQTKKSTLISSAEIWLEQNLALVDYEVT